MRSILLTLQKKIKKKTIETSMERSCFFLLFCQGEAIVSLLLH